MPVIMPKSLVKEWLNDSPEMIDEALTDLQFTPVPSNDKQPQQLRLDSGDD